jgi:hypothetical protein
MPSSMLLAEIIARIKEFINTPMEANRGTGWINTAGRQIQDTWPGIFST